MVYVSVLLVNFKRLLKKKQISIITHKLIMYSIRRIERHIICRSFAMNVKDNLKF